MNTLKVYRNILKHLWHGVLEKLQIRIVSSEYKVEISIFCFKLFAQVHNNVVCFQNKCIFYGHVGIKFK